jgi:hypothetical protein
MRNIRDPNQTELFSPFAGMFSETQLKLISRGWAGTFRHVILACLPAEKVGAHFHPEYGVPTKEIYSMIGLIVLAETFDWTEEETVHRYLLDLEVRYALNRSGTNDTMSAASLQRYRRILREDGLAQEIFSEITDRLITELDLDVGQQRLDSTHVFSDMASFGRTRLMGVTIKRFLTALKRHDPDGYDALPDELHDRYRPSAKRLFADSGGTANARRCLRQQVAEDMLLLVQRFADHPDHGRRSTFADLKRCLYEQCDVDEARTAVTLKTKTGGDIMQNPSDPDATYDGKKGPGYQVQCSETCSIENEAQLVVGMQAETAVDHDAHAVEPMLEQLEERDALPMEMQADTAYGSDANVEAAERLDVELVSPTSGTTPDDVDALGPDDIVVDEKTGVITRCPVGEKPTDSWIEPKSGVAMATMDGDTCMRCPYQCECPMSRHVVKNQGEHDTDGPQPVLKVTKSARRRHGRQREEQTEVFRERYRRRAGIESTFSSIKRRTGLGRIRRRGRPSVFMSIALKITGWNILRASSCTALQEKVDRLVRRALRALIFMVVMLERAVQGTARSLGRSSQPSVGRPAAVPDIIALLGLPL